VTARETWWQPLLRGIGRGAPPVWRAAVGTTFAPELQLTNNSTDSYVAVAAPGAVLAGPTPVVLSSTGAAALAPGDVLETEALLAVVGAAEVIVKVLGDGGAQIASATSIGGPSVARVYSMTSVRAGSSSSTLVGVEILSTSAASLNLVHSSNNAHALLSTGPLAVTAEVASPHTLSVITARAWRTRGVQTL
jgi:hypothetical protein